MIGKIRDMLTFEGLAYACYDYPDMVEDMVETFCLITEDVLVPRYTRISKKLRAMGFDIWYTDCDGDVRPLIPHFLEGVINCLFPFEVNGCYHPAELLFQYDGELRIMGSVDKFKLIEGKESKKEYLETLAPPVEKGGYIPFCDHRCPPDVQYDMNLRFKRRKKI